MQLPPPFPPRTALIGLALAVAVAVAFAVWRLQPPAAEEGAEIEVLDSGSPVTGLPAAEREEAPTPTAPATITVHVVGPVARPGVIVLPVGARVADAIAAAGGLQPGAVSAANLARVLADGERLDAAGAAPPDPLAGPDGGVSAGIDINAASAAELEELPGVGPVLAQRIVDYRRMHGGFTTVEQLQEVSGIGASRAADLADLIVVGPAPAAP